MTVTATKPAINIREALKRGVSMYGLQIATALQGGALNDVSIGGRTPAAGAFNALSLVSTDGPTLLVSNGGGTSPAPTLSLFRQTGVSATISYDAASKNLEIQNDYSTVDAFGNIYFKTRGNNTRMTIDGAGNVGIGTAAPDSDLHVDGHITVGSSDRVGCHSPSGAAETAIKFTDGGAGGEKIDFYVNNSISQTMIANGALLHGTTVAGSAGAGDIVVNGGIFLGGSAAANEISDAEEGTWTPVLSDGTNSDATYAIQVGHYTKIGNKVHVQGRITLSALGTISGDLRITGLPFTSHSAGDGNSAVTIGYAEGLAITAGHNLGGVISPSVSYLDLRLWDSTIGVSKLQAAEFTADGGIIFSAEYITA